MSRRASNTLRQFVLRFAALTVLTLAVLASLSLSASPERRQRSLADAPTHVPGHTETQTKR